MKDFDAVVFDMDGVIFDSERATMNCWIELADKYDIKNIEKPYLACTGTTDQRTREIMIEAYGDDFPYDKYAKEASQMYHERYDGGKLPVKNGVKEILDFLKQHNKKIALASSTKRQKVINQLRDAGILDYFDEIVTGDMVSKSKPDPEIFLLACDKLDVSYQRAYAIEDSYNGVRSAHRGGLRPIMVPDLLPADDEMRRISETVLDDLIAVVRYLKDGLNPCGTEDIETDRLFLRKFTYEDAKSMLNNWVADDNIQHMYGEPSYKTYEAVRSLLDKYIEGYNDEHFFRWAVTEKGSGECIGQIAYFLVDRNNHFGEIEYCIGSSYQGRGYASEVTRAVIDYGFDRIGFHKVQICVRPSNTPSRKVIEKCGFEYEGTLRDYFYMDGKYEDRMYFSIIRKDPNPWEDIRLSDYENHMRLDSVRQLQTLNEMMKQQFENFNVSTCMILGIAAGNGLEHVSKEKYAKVYGIDINKEYLKAVLDRYASLSGILECICLDLTKDCDSLPDAELVIANLLIEYIGYEAFSKAVEKIRPRYVSCIIQINTDMKNWVSDSPYLHCFDRLDDIHHEIKEDELGDVMSKIGYRVRNRFVKELPNGKALMRLDYESKA